MSKSTSNYSYSSSSFSSSSLSSSLSDGQSHSQRYTEISRSDDRDGTTTRRVMEETGQPTVDETTTIPAGKAVEGDAAQGRIEDVTDQEQRDRQYEQRMEDEYAKREGGA